jgi:hypothetical protein
MLLHNALKSLPCHRLQPLQISTCRGSMLCLLPLAQPLLLLLLVCLQHVQATKRGNRPRGVRVKVKVALCLNGSRDMDDGMLSEHLAAAAALLSRRRRRSSSTAEQKQ